jgi:hypothetical protein
LGLQTTQSSWPNAEVALVGASLAAAFRPMARDLAQSLAPPGSDDPTLETAAEVLVDEDERLIDERLEQENRHGITLQGDGSMLFEGPRLDRQGLATCLRTMWVPRRAPKNMIGYASLEVAQAKRVDQQTSWILIHDPTGPERMPGALKCPLTGKRLGLAGDAAVRLLNRNQRQNYALWAWLEPAIEAGASVLIGNQRDQLLQTWAKAWFSAP